MYCFKDDNAGKFVFPKDVLLEQGILKHHHQPGKMAFRVYPTWDSVTSKQAMKTKQWQSRYFDELRDI